jgi:hypothetical protein
VAGWDDLVRHAQPALLGGGLEISGLAEGCTWYVELQITDDTDAPVDWTGITAEGFVYSTRESGAVVTTWDVTLPAAGQLVIRKEAAETAGLANQNAAHAIFLAKAATNERIAVCLPASSPCPIRSED